MKNIYNILKGGLGLWSNPKSFTKPGKYPQYIASSSCTEPSNADCTIKYDTAYCAQKFLSDPGAFTSLNLNGQRDLDQSTCELLAEIFANNVSPLTRLDLSNCQLGSKKAEIIASGLRDNKSIEYLVFGDNMLGDGGAVAFAEGFKGNRALYAMQLYNNQIGEEGAAAIAECLPNSSLQKLSLYNNKIGDRGASAIGGSQETSLLGCIDLANNFIGDEGAEGFSAALIDNKMLEFVSLSNNKIGDIGTIMIADALYKNNTLRYLYLENNYIGSVGANELEQKVHLNRALRFNDFSWWGRPKEVTKIKSEGQEGISPHLVFYKDNQIFLYIGDQKTISNNAPENNNSYFLLPSMASEYNAETKTLIGDNIDEEQI